MKRIYIELGSGMASAEFMVVDPDKLEALSDERLQIPEQKLRDLITENAKIIIGEQNPETGLFPAATRAHRVEEGHYGDSWVRDNAAILKGLLVVRESLPEGELKKEITDTSVLAIKKSLEAYGSEPWSGAFGQLVFQESKEGYTHLTQPAPPIHTKTDGSECLWPRQNQPDSWGAYLADLYKAMNQGIFKPDDREWQTISLMAHYLVNIKVEKFEASSMWENAEVRNPPPISTALLVQEGLERAGKMYREKGNLNKYERELLAMIDRRVNAIDDFVAKNYPEDFTWKEIHRSRTDLATLVAFGYSDHEHLSFARYMALANQELGNGDLPGKIRFKGDPYYMNEGREAVWLMALPLEAIILARLAQKASKNGSPESAVLYKDKARSRLKKALAITDEVGYVPELFINKGNSFEPNNNDLLWGRALMMEAAARYLDLAEVSLPAKKAA